MKLVYSNKRFILEVSRIHNGKYDYSKTLYKGCRSKIIVTCPTHGDFSIVADCHKQGAGCPSCSKENLRKRILNDGIATFLSKSKNKFGDKYDYSNVSYINNQTKVCIICPIHGEFWQTPSNHLKNNGCPSCSYSKTKYNQKNTNIFINESRAIHGDKYDYSKVEYVNSYTKVCIKCSTHGFFWQKPKKHLEGQGCPICAKYRNINTPTFYKVGIMDLKDNDNSVLFKKCVEKWSGMLERCYCKKTITKHKTYMNCVVCDDWLRFSNFKKWFDENYIKGCHLDKDLLSKTQSIYSPDTCCFLPSSLNTLFRKPKKYNGIYKKKDFFIVQYHKGKKLTSKKFNTFEDAYIFRKNKFIEYASNTAKEEYNRGNISHAVYEIILNAKYNVDKFLLVEQKVDIHELNKEEF